jgi:hypothetical protein
MGRSASACWVYLDMVRNGPGPSLRLDELYRDAAVIVNVCGATGRATQPGARLIYVRRITSTAAPDRSATARPLGFLDDVLFTYGENIGNPDCLVPLGDFEWKKTRPPVVMDCWQGVAAPEAQFFTTVASFSNKGKDVTWQGQTYQWSKHTNFLRFLDLPQHTPQPFRLAMKPESPETGARPRGRLGSSTRTDVA